MALSKTKGSTIKGIVSVVPQSTEDNLTLQSIATEEERELLVLHTGIRFRRKLDSVESSVKDLFKSGVDRLLEKLKWEKDSIDILICVTQTPHTSVPSISCQLHGDMVFPVSTMCYDINSGCSGFVYGLHTVSMLLSSIEKTNARAILCCGDVSSSLISPDDSSVKPIFSDAVSVIGIENEEGQAVTGYFNLQTDGSGQKAICMTNEKEGTSYMTLNGIDVFNYSLKLVPPNIRDLFVFSDKTIEFPDLYVFHQANKIINDSIRKNLKIEEKKVPSTLYEYGNTASASIPLTLGKIWNKGLKKSGWLVISGFGVGFSVASAIIKFDPLVCEAPIALDF